MLVMTSEGPAGLLLRRLLPSAFAVVVVAGWLRIQGQRLGLYGTELGTALMVILTMVLLALLLVRSARSMYRTEALRREADERARESDQRITQLLESLPVGVFVIDAEGKPFYANRAAERLLGQGIRPEATPDRLAETYHAYVAGTNQPYPTERLPIVRALAGERSRVDDMDIHHPDGVRRIEVEGGPILDPQGRVVNAMAVFTNITARKEAEDALRAAQQEADAANRAKSEFLSRMSHELRTPLNAILGFGQLLEMDELDPEHRESLAQILKAGRHLVDLIDEVLDISRIEAGRLSLSLEPVALEEAVRESLELLAPSAKQRAVALEWDAEAAAGRYILADRQRLKQVLLNLLSNAVKYNRPEGEVRASFREDDGRIRVEIADTGPGIPAEQRRQLFVPFERLGQSEVEGTGLGLALSKGLVEAMGGRIGMESRDGEGSVFWLELVAAQPAVAPMTEHEHEEPLPSATLDRPRTVLHIEDNPVNLGLVEKVLARRPGVRLLSAMQGGMGLELAREHRPDLVLLDAHLPDMPGEEVLRRLREDPATRHVPVVVISADAMADRVQRFLAAGARAYLTKPLDVRRLLGLVAEAGDVNAAAPPS
jgi:PAS domain S-box-containing protein